MIAWFDLGSIPRPIRFRVDGGVIKVHMSITDEKQAVNRMKIYRCQSEIGGQLKPFELKFKLQTQVVFMQSHL